jgi:hypothetical protein
MKQHEAQSKSVERLALVRNGLESKPADAAYEAKWRLRD